MNPGKIVDSPPMTENLRIAPSYRTVAVETGLSYSREGGFASAIEMCNGQGACRKVLGGTMCPSYMATRDEEHSTRGRANALRAAVSGRLPVESLTARRMYEVMELCLECKACKAECPSNVDVAKLKYEFMDRYRRTNGASLRDTLFGNLSTINRMGAFFAPLSNWALRSDVVRQALPRSHWHRPEKVPPNPGLTELPTVVESQRRAARLGTYGRGSCCSRTPSPTTTIRSWASPRRR